MKKILDNIPFKLQPILHPLIILIGPPGAGKTVVGQQLAVELDWRFIDTDASIEEATGIKIVEIFAQFGELAFRKLEKRLLDELFILAKQHGTTTAYAGKGTILSCGGGFPIPPENFSKLSKMGTIIALVAPIPVLAQRVGNIKSRPLLSGDPFNNQPNEEQHTHTRLQMLVDARKEVYAKASLTIDTNNMTIESVVKHIIKKAAL